MICVFNPSLSFVSNSNPARSPFLENPPNKPMTVVLAAVTESLSPGSYEKLNPELKVCPNCKEEAIYIEDGFDCCMDCGYSEYNGNTDNIYNTFRESDRDIIGFPMGKTNDRDICGYARGKQLEELNKEKK